MDMSSAIYSIANSNTSDAIKRPTWGGYVYRGEVNEETGAYALTFKTRDASEYTFNFDGSSWTAPTANPLVIDGELMESILADDWVTGLASEFEVARSGSGIW